MYIEGIEIAVKSHDIFCFSTKESYVFRITKESQLLQNIQRKYIFEYTDEYWCKLERDSLKRLLLKRNPGNGTGWPLAWKG